MVDALGWEFLYRVEPELYVRLTAGERLHPGVLDWLPRHADTAVEIGPGWGRLTRELVPRSRRVVAVEPAATMRTLLRDSGAHVVAGFFEDLPVRERVADLVVACSSFTAEDGHGGEAGLREMERVCARGGLVVVIWPQDASWLEARGFATVTFDGAMAVEFASPEEAVELAGTFYPDAAAEVARRGSASVPYDVLGISAPRTLCWKRIGP